MRKLVDIRTQSRWAYPVFVGDDLAAFFAEVWSPTWRQAAVVGDENTVTLFGDSVESSLVALGVKVLTLSFPPGETHKTRQTKARLEDAMLDAGIERSACVVGLGGGIALDMAGFIAATYLRGIAAVHIPTSLLAQVDASVGGKTAVNTPHGKNLIGAFYPPAAVLLPIPWLSSLPAAELRNGLAEAVKMALIADVDLLEFIESLAARPAAHEASGDDDPESRPLASRVGLAALSRRILTGPGRETNGASLTPTLRDSSTAGESDSGRGSSSAAENVTAPQLGQGQEMCVAETDAPEAPAASAPGSLQHIIEHCVRIKASIVMADERESGLRRVLNFGHTIGHAIELASGHTIAHGAAVAFGMLVECRIAEEYTGFPKSDTTRIDRLVSRLALCAVDPPPFERIAAVLAADKKTRDARIHCALPLRLGQMDRAGGQYARAVPVADIKVAWDRAVAETRGSPKHGDV